MAADLTREEIEKLAKIGPAHDFVADVGIAFEMAANVPALLSMLARRDRRVEELEEALRKIERWDLPKVNDNGKELSYGAAYGSNGERSYVQVLARAALAAERTP